MATTRTGGNGRSAMLNVGMDFRLAGDLVQTLYLRVVARNARNMAQTLNQNLASRNPVKVNNMFGIFLYICGTTFS
jgi:hypothetical protein